MGVRMVYHGDADSYGVQTLKGVKTCKKGTVVLVDEKAVAGLEAEGFRREGDDAPADDPAGEAGGDERDADADGDGGGSGSAVVDEEVATPDFAAELEAADKTRLIEIGRSLDVDFNVRWGEKRLRKVIRQALEG